MLFLKPTLFVFFVPCLIVKTGILISWSTQKLAKSALEVHPILLHSLSTVELPLTATSLHGHFFWRTVHTFTLVSNSLQLPPLYNGHFLLSSRCRLSHKLPMNPKKLKLPIKVSKSCQKVAEKLPKFFCFSYLFWVLKIKNSHIASYQNFICQSPMIISEVLSISLDQQIVYQNDMNKTW